MVSACVGMQELVTQQRRVSIVDVLGFGRVDRRLARCRVERVATVRAFTHRHGVAPGAHVDTLGHSGSLVGQHECDCEVCQPALDLDRLRLLRTGGIVAAKQKQNEEKGKIFHGVYQWS